MPAAHLTAVPVSQEPISLTRAETDVFRVKKEIFAGKYNEIYLNYNYMYYHEFIFLVSNT